MKTSFVIVFEWLDSVTLSWCDDVINAYSKDRKTESEVLADVRLECQQNKDAVRISVFTDRRGALPMFIGESADVSRQIQRHLTTRATGSERSPAS